MIRLTISTLILLLLAVVIQQFLPAIPAWGQARVLLVPLVFLCATMALDFPGMLVLAFVGGFLWDAQNTLAIHHGDPDVYTTVGSLRFGYSIVLYGLMGILMQGVQPWFRRGRWQISVVFGAVTLFLYLLAEYLLLAFVRGEWMPGAQVVGRMAASCVLTMFLAPPVFMILARLERAAGTLPQTTPAPPERRVPTR